jgi:hypothetical protein
VVAQIAQEVAYWDNAFDLAPWVGGGSVLTNVFLKAAKAYKDLGTKRDSTQVAAVASKFQAQNKVLIGCLAMAVEAFNIRPNTNSVGYRV